MPTPIAAYTDLARTGELYFDPQSALDAHKATADWITALRTMITDAREIQRVEGFPDFSEAEQLAAKFDRLASGDTGLRMRLSQFLDVATEMAELFRLSIERFATEDGILTHYLKTLEDPSKQARGTATLGAGYSSAGAK